MSSTTLLLNIDYTFNNFIDARKAVRLVVKGKAEVLKYSDRVIKSYNQLVRIPLVLKLIKAIRGLYKKGISLSRKAIIIRDEYKCQYCGNSLGKDNKPTIDHIIPKSRGGKHSFENCVACCSKCNGIKNNRTPREANMFLIKQPIHPTIMEFIQKKLKVLGIDSLVNDLINSID